MGRSLIGLLAYFLVAGVVALGGGAVFGQVEAPAEELQIDATTARTWSSGDGAIVTLEGPVSIRTDRARLYAEQAVIWFASAPGSPDTQLAEIALLGNAKIQQSTGTRSGSRLMVSLPVRGAIRFSARERLAADASDSELYRQASLMRATGIPLPPDAARGSDRSIPGSTAGTTLPATGPDATVATTRPAAPVSFQAKDIDTRLGPDGTVMVLLSGDVTLLQSRPNGDFVELLADRVVLFTPLNDLRDLEEADRIREVSQAVSAAYLEGDVRVLFTPAAKDKPDQRLEAERVYYEFQSDRAVLTDAVIHTYDLQRGIPIVLRAQTVRQLAVGEYSTEKVELTTSTFAVPSYSVRATSAYVRQYDTGDPRLGDRTVFRARNATLNAFGLPVFYLPVVGGSVTDRGSALRDLQFGGGSGFGLGVRTRWGLFETLGRNPPPGLDASYRLDYFSERGPAGGFDFDYNGGYIDPATRDPWNFEGNFKSYIVLDDGTDRYGADRARRKFDEEVRYRLMFEHQHFFPDDWQIQLRAGAVSDSGFLEEWFENDFDTGLPTDVSAYIKQQKDNWALTALVQFQPSDAVTNAENYQEVNVAADGTLKAVEVERLPEVAYRRIGDSLADDQLSFFSDNTLSALHFNTAADDMRGDLGFRGRNRDPVSGEFEDDARFIGVPSFAQTGTPNDVTYRADFREELNWPLHAENVRIVPFLLGRYTAYSDSPDDGSQNRLLVGAGARIGTTFWKQNDSIRSVLFDVNRVRHVIEPQVQLFTSVATEDRNELFIYDEQIDGVNDISAVQLAIRQRWQTKRGAPGRERSVDFFAWNVEANFFANQPDEFAGLDFDPGADDRSGIQPDGFRGLYFYSHPESSLARSSINTDALWRISDTTVLLSDLQWNLDEFDLATTSIGLAARRDPRLRYFTGLRYIGELNSTIASFAFDYELTSKYKFSLAQSFDLSDNGRNSTNFTVTRRFDRFFATVTVFYDDLEDTSGVRFAIFPEGLGYGLDTGQFESALGRN